MRAAFGVVLVAALGSNAVAAAEDANVSKKQSWLADKATRADVRAVKLPAKEPLRPITLHNMWTDESLPVSSERDLGFSSLIRCHYTNQATQVDERLLGVVVRAARKFGQAYVEIVSGYRAPKYQLMLRKKGHEVARDSEHPLGHAVDFRLPGVPVKRLVGFVRSLRLGGVGYYPRSQFVHADTGRLRFWKGH